MGLVQGAKLSKERAIELLDLQAVMKTEQGRRVLRRILDSTGVFRTSFVVDPGVTAFNEGRRDIGLRLMTDMAEADSAEYASIMTLSIKGAKK